MKAVVCLALLSLFAVSSAYPYHGHYGWGWGWPYHWGADYWHGYPGYYHHGFYGWYRYGHYPDWVKGKSYKYYGKYVDACDHDGFYYNDADSFVICSNGNAYRMECAPGSKNSGLGHFKSGHDYYHHDFCDVNLVAKNKY